MNTTVQPTARTMRSSIQPRWPERLAQRLIGGGFLVAAVGNAVGTLPRAEELIGWFRDSAWLPPYPWVLSHLVDAAPVVVGATVLFEAGIGVMLLLRRGEELALGLATAWVVGLIPAVGWPFWLANVPLSLLSGWLWWRAHRRNKASALTPASRPGRGKRRAVPI
jgi:hypothetical protein